jgi:uncharacterized membrane protein YphA (DoxX/SURF4 family)
VQRLFSMFPSGVPGIALIFLRVCVAATLLVDGTDHWTLVTSSWIFLLVVLIAACLCLGLLTPVCASLSCLMGLYALAFAGRQEIFYLAIHILTGASLAILGPGSYSIDAPIFGRQLLTVPSRQRPHSN